MQLLPVVINLSPAERGPNDSPVLPIRSIINSYPALSVVEIHCHNPSSEGNDAFVCSGERFNSAQEWNETPAGTVVSQVGWVLERGK